MIETISETSISTLLRCPRLWQYRYVDRLEPVVVPPALSMGRAFAAGLEAGSASAAEAEIRCAANDAAERAMSSPWAGSADPTTIEIQAATVRAAVDAYLLRFGFAERREVEYRTTIGKVSLVCRIDAIDGDTIIEDKFVARFAPTGQPAILRQLTIEAFSYWIAHDELPKEIRYRQVKKPAIRQRRDETLEGFCERIEAEYIEKPDTYIDEIVTTRTTEDMYEIGLELSVWAAQQSYIRRFGHACKNTDACLRFGKCEFLPLCTREPGAEHQFCQREKAKQ